MREVNFSIPSANKASVGITTALYDRRALDCTSTLPLINSLNHLAYLTASSARIRDILTIDGGVERLVVILKEGRSKDLMSMWKWNLAFQCVVNIGVRGSEIVRTRVVEADMVPVIATILDNYIQVMDRVNKRNAAVAHIARARERSSSFGVRRSAAPQAIAIPPQVTNAHSGQADLFTANQRTHAGQAPRQQSHGRHHHHTHHHHHHHHHHDNRQMPYNHTPTGSQPAPTINTAVARDLGLQPVRDVDRLPSMAPAGGPSQPASPTTPNPPNTITPSFNDRIVGPQTGLPSIRHQRSISGESDDGNSDDRTSVANRNEPIVDIQSGVNMERDSILGSADEPMALALPESQGEAETFNITHRSPINGSIIAGGPATPVLGFSPNPPAVANPPLSLQMPTRYMEGPVAVIPSMPREEDVLMSLQLLAYVSKYCNLRSYFQNSHLVPRLSIERELRLENNSKHHHMFTNASKSEEIEEYLLPDDFNIFPLVEKFTVRHHPPDMQYWAGVVMRNLCRKDENNGGIRQCAYYECGKWEEYTRQFAKCRRCRRTKYCSKECQKSAWVYHRHWCVAAQQ
ncbi:hypothetical protein FN846DRAFT_909386 [Sphaerosporella brunnea]|uniref:MYND-type zinc finger protein samB n=1 Tax=Sphaerosporella brunnea TaxID=1250544 RepID=A0A5J5ERC7_9PEZI|nr:hypothetical protein FN846DRAFT_909386 [Sphaerosporella brunnea]